MRDVWNTINDWPCENTVRAAHYSPDNQLKVVEYTRDCGVSSDHILEYRLLKAADPLPDNNGDVFRCDAESEWRTGKRLAIVVKWVSDRRLSISYPARVEVVGKMESLRLEGIPGEVSVEYHVSEK